MINKRKQSFGIAFILIVFIYIITIYLITRNDNDDIFPNIGRKKLKILIYTSQFFDLPWYGVPYDYSFTENDGKPCVENRCVLTYQKDEIDSSDVVIFHGSWKELPPVEELWRIKQSTLRNKWIWYFLESPVYQKEVTEDYDGLFDLTASYHTKSDIHIPYYTFKKYVEKNSTWKNQLMTHNFAKNKDKMILFINSHCDFRIDIVKKLKEFVSIDVYGSCKDEFHQNLDITTCKRNTAECEKLQRRYKFYLALENSFCEDYVTEKYYEQSLLKGLVPIMMGPVNYEDDRLIVPNSFIDMERFKNFEELADYLNYLDSNDTAYNQYFAWRQHYKYVDANAMCKICKGLWTKDLQEENDLKLSEFFSKSKCTDPQEYLSKYI